MNFYREMVPSFSLYTTSISRLTKNIETNGIERLINLKIESHLIGRFSMSHLFYRQILATGAVVEKRINDKEYIISVYSYKLTPSEKVWETSGRELLGIYKAITNNRDYLCGNTVLTDIKC